MRLCSTTLVLLMVCLFTQKVYTQDSSCSPKSEENAVSTDEDAMNWELSHDFMETDTERQQGDCPVPLACPGPLVLGTNTVGCGMIVNYGISYWVLDDCPGYTIECNPPSGSFFFPGVTSAFCRLLDPQGNLMASCPIDIVVVTECPYDCPQEIILDNETTFGLYHADGTVSASSSTTSGSDVFFRAGNTIELQNNFSAPASTDFSIEIEDCSSNFGDNDDQN